MALPLLGVLVAGGTIGLGLTTALRNKERTRQAGMQYADSLDANCIGIGVMQPSGAASLCLPEEQRSAIRAMIDVNPKEGIRMAETMTANNIATQQFQQEMDYRYATLDQRAQEHALDLREHDLAERQHELNTDLDWLARKGAATRGYEFRLDGETGGVVQVPMPGTEEYQQRLASAYGIGQGFAAMNALRMDVAQNNVITVDSAGKGRQESLANQIVLAIKRNEELGALDAGLLGFAEGITMNQLSVKDFLTGSGVEVLERLEATSRLFRDKYNISAWQIRNLRDQDPGLTGAFARTGQADEIITQQNRELISRHRAAGTDIVPLNRRQEFDRLGREGPGPGDMMDRARELRNILGTSAFDFITDIF